MYTEERFLGDRHAVGWKEKRCRAKSGISEIWLPVLEMYRTFLLSPSLKLLILLDTLGNFR
jgi:hypothetical protein